jgi:hypothetical protein
VSGERATGVEDVVQGGGDQGREAGARRRRHAIERAAEAQHAERQAAFRRISDLASGWDGRPGSCPR